MKAWNPKFLIFWVMLNSLRKGNDNDIPQTKRPPYYWWLSSSPKCMWQGWHNGCWLMLRSKQPVRKSHSENEHLLTGASWDQHLKLTTVNSELWRKAMMGQRRRAFRIWEFLRLYSYTPTNLITLTSFHL